MPLSLTTSPQYPVASKGARISFAPTTGNFVRLWCTAAPTGSKLQAQLDDSAASRVMLHEGDAAALPALGISFDFKPDVPGLYAVAAQEYTRGASAYGGAYQGDPRGFSTETKVGAEVTASITFGERVTSTIGVGADTATLAFWVWGDTIRATSVALHGERTPAVTKPTSSTANTAAGDAVVLVALSLFDGQTVTTIVGSTQDTMINSFIDTMSAHFGDAAAHAAADATNPVPVAFKNPTTKTATPKVVAKLMERYSAHITNDLRAGAGLGSGGFHVVAATNVTDGTNALVSPVPNDMASAYAALGELWYAYAAHRTSVVVHVVADTTSIVSTPPLMMRMHGAFRRSIQKANPTAVATENSGAALAANVAGMKRG